MVNKLPPLAGPVDASGEKERFTAEDIATLIIAVARDESISDERDLELCAKLQRYESAAASVPSSPAQQDIRLMTDFQIVEVLKSRAAHDANNEFGRWIGRLLTAWVTDSPLTDIDAILAERLPPSSPVADSPTDYRAACEVLPDSLGRPLAARIQLVLDNLRRESHIGCELRRELDGGIERDAKAVEERWPEAAAYLRSHTHIEDGA